MHTSVNTPTVPSCLVVSILTMSLSTYLSIAKVEVDSLGMSNVQDTIGLRREPSNHLSEGPWTQERGRKHIDFYTSLKNTYKQHVHVYISVAYTPQC